MKYPKGLKRFQWNTSVLREGAPFKQSFTPLKNLPQQQDTSAFQEYIKKSRNKYVVAFPNLSKDSMLVIPMPGKNYTTLKDFIDNAPKIQQQEFWKKVAKVAKKFVKENGEAWISVHGMGVNYTHVRIDPYPKYYFDKKLI